MRNGVVAVVVGASLCLLPIGAGAHSWLTDPVPQLPQTPSTASPCGQGAMAGASTKTYMVGEMVDVSFFESQVHQTFRISIGTDGVTFPSILLNNIPAGTAGTMRTVSVQMPAMPCDPCVMQLRQANGGGAYYSCADIRIVATLPTTTSTTTTPVDDSTTTTTTLKPSCDDQQGFDRAECHLTEALADDPCDDEAVDPALAAAAHKALLKAQQLVGAARLKSKPQQVRGLLRKADRKVAGLVKKSARTAKRGRISWTCDGSIEALVETLRSAIAGAAPL